MLYNVFFNVLFIVYFCSCGYLNILAIELMAVLPAHIYIQRKEGMFFYISICFSDLLAL